MYNVTEDGIEMVMWIGQQTPIEFVVNVFGVNSQAEIDVESVRILFYNSHIRTSLLSHIVNS